MKIKEDHRLYHDDDTPFPFVESPNVEDGLDHDYLLWHYTANNNGASAIRVLSELRTPRNKGVSAHLVIDLDGTITQLVPFDKRAWHAGSSHWEGKRWLNRNSIGIEIVNDGKLKQTGKSDQFISSNSNKIYSRSEILVAPHPAEFFEAGWPHYPQAQLDAVFEVSKLLIEHYKLKDALGHEDVADARIGKIDPGPAFPKEEFRERLFNRREPIIVRYELTETVEVIRETDNVPRFKFPEEHKLSPLPSKTTVNVKKIDKGWVMVRIKGEKDGWIDEVDLDLSVKTKGVTLNRAKVYAFQPDPKPPLHEVGKLPKGLPVRILREENPFVLIANLQNVPNFKVVHGWVPRTALRRIDPSS